MLNLLTLKTCLDIPKSYRTTDINKNGFKPIITELSTIFNNLHINKIKAKISNPYR
ncbi:TPA: hypothetical protein ACXJQT_003757 [Clostridioides difficile]